IEVREVDINSSMWDCTLERTGFDPGRILDRHAEMRGVIRSEHAVRLGFRQIKGLSEADMEALVRCRGGGYGSVRDLWLRSGLAVDEIEKLAQADAFRSIGLDRRAALWQVRALDRKTAAETMPLFDRPDIRLPDNEPATQLPVMPSGEHVIHDYRSLGLSLKAHPVSFLREQLESLGVTPNEDLPRVPDRTLVSVAGLVLVRQRPGKGNAIFLTLEDDKAVANVIVWKRDFSRLLPVIMSSKFVRVTGRLQSESGVVHIVAENIEDLTSWLSVLLEEAAHSEPASTPSACIAVGVQDRRKLAPFTRRNAPVGTTDAETLARKAGSVMPKGRNFQ
ncbi:MAG: OB-fold nucleic acid binding domain-containing protein, partial [Pseudomonadota bacterium]|nr:OB-fold nucleic acid binding domain-containing protein [Pseudomonadota bacterium]